MRDILLTLGGATAAAVAAYFLLPSFRRFGLPADLNGDWVIVLAAAMVTILLKCLIQRAVFGTYQLHKQGHDFCILTLGTCLATAASEYLVAGLRMAELFGVFVFALIAVFITAELIKTIDGPPPAGNPPLSNRKKGFLSGVSFCIGIFMFVLNAGILMTKKGCK